MVSTLNPHRGFDERHDDLAVKIFELHEAYTNGRTKRTAEHYLSGLVGAYAIVFTDDPDDLDAALAQALDEAQKQ